MAIITLVGYTDNVVPRKMSFSPDGSEHGMPINSVQMCDASMAYNNGVVDQNGYMLDAVTQQQPLASPGNPATDENGLMPKPSDSLHSPAVTSTIRRRSSSNGVSGPQRKGSLPSDYISNSNTLSLSNEWSREKVADMAHQARQRMQNPSNSTATTFKKIGVSFAPSPMTPMVIVLSVVVHPT